MGSGVWGGGCWAQLRRRKRWTSRSARARRCIWDEPDGDCGQPSGRPTPCETWAVAGCGKLAQPKAEQQEPGALAGEWRPASARPVVRALGRNTISRGQIVMRRPPLGSRQSLICVVRSHLIFDASNEGVQLRLFKYLRAVRGMLQNGQRCSVCID